MNRGVIMKRKEFGVLIVGLAAFPALPGCKSRIGKSAYDAEMGEPYRCEKCGHLVRSKDDLHGTRCPRCYAKAMKRITEEEAQKILAEAAA